jgi:hypothetical protein
MDSRDVVGLYEAYQEVYEAKADERVRPENLGDVRNRRSGFSTSKGRRAEHRERRGLRGNIGGEGGSGYRYDDNSDKDYPSIKVRGRGYVEESNDVYDLVLDHLLDEGYCDDVESAEVIMANMGEEWLNEIVEGFVSPYKTRPTYGNPQGTSPAMKALKKSDDLQKTELGSPRQKKQTRRSQQLNRIFQAARQGA